MRLHFLVAALVVSACVQQLPPPLVQPSWPTLEPSPPPPTMTSTQDPAVVPTPPSHSRPDVIAGYNEHVVALRTTLGRAGIQLEMRSPAADSIRMTACDAGQHDCYECKLAGETDPLDSRVLDAVTKAIERYPTTVLEATHIERVSLCRALLHDGEADTTTIGTVDLGARRLVISLAPFIGEQTYDAEKHATSSAEDIVHHELFHLFEYERMRAAFDLDPEWDLQNPLGFTYASQPEDKPRRDGFVNTYARTNAVEDKASVYQLLMAHPDELCRIERVDPIVRAKVRILWNRIAAVTDDAYLSDRALCGSL